MAFFTFNGVTKELKVAAVKPAVLSTVFKLEPNTIAITDQDDEGKVHLADGARFNPPLIDRHRYSVDGAELASVVAQRTAEMKRQVAEIEGQQRDNLITVLISTTSDLDQSVGMLYNAPQAVVLVEALAILAAAAPDPSLVSENMPAEKFTRLKTPSSFKASLYQVASSMCNAFRTADVSMMTIKAKLVDLPDDFVSTLEVIGENDDVATQKILKRTTDRIAEASKKCVEMAKKSSVAFDETIKDIDELCQAANVAKGTNEAALKELEKLKEDLDREQEELRTTEEELQKQHEDTKKRVKEALQEYKDQVAKSGNFGKMRLATLCDGMMDTVKEVVSLLAKMWKMLKEKLPKLPWTEKCSPTMRYAMESNLLQMLEKIIEDLARPGEMGEETVKDYILSLKDSERLVQAETDQIRMRQSHHTEESQKEEKLRKELKETTMERSGILGNLTSLDPEKVDLDDIISYLQEGINYLGKVKENWDELAKSFNAILILVETNLKGNIDSFLKEAQDPASTGRMLRSVLKATSYCIQVGNCAEIYTKVSSKYVMPIISGVGKEFALTKAEATAKKGDIENMLNASVLGLRDEQLKEEEILRQLQRKNERHDENTKNCVIVQGGLAGACAVLGALAVIFPPVGVPALFAVGGTAATGVAAGVVGIIEQAKKASEEKLNSLRENISNVSRHLDQLKKEIKNDEECVQCYRKQIDEANVKLDQANRSIIKCGDMQKNIHIWTDHLGAWIAFLIKITPEAARIQRNVKGNTSSLRRSIEEFKITFSGEINILIEACAKILAIQN
ncbi:unnamed protein product, partial [Mesorhabditis belari]|uniref:Uncharacterized protein n=1 Tax=Mesorhabditis belari TaxID=2138241 RepID=A0AAF3EUZ3_9BILA